MGYTIPKEIQEKLIIIEKEMVFYQERKPPEKKLIISGAIMCLLAIVFSINNRNYFEPAFFLLLGVINIATYIEYQKFYKLYSNARDIIKYYKGRGVTNET